MPAGGPVIDASLAARLVASQFPRWAHLPIAPAAPDGWDNRTFRLGSDLSVRLPSAAAYSAQVDKEHRWLPVLAPHLPLPVPVPVAIGGPDHGYPWRWSVYRWLEGEPASVARIDDPRALAETLAGFLVALGRVDPTRGPPPGPHNFFRGGPLATYDTDTRSAIAALGDQIPAAAATAVWEAALGAEWDGRAVWLHGDVSADNLLVGDGRLSAVIDFGCAGVGDPACDVTIAWTMLSGGGREAFRAALGAAAATWARGRGWALWKALITLAGSTDPLAASAARRVLAAVLGEHAGRGVDGVTSGIPGLR